MINLLFILGGIVAIAFVILIEVAFKFQSEGRRIIANKVSFWRNLTGIIAVLLIFIAVLLS